MVTVSFVLPGNFSKWDCVVGCNHTGGICKISLGGSKSLWIWVPILYVLSPLNWLFFVQQFPFFAFPKGWDSSDHQVHLKPLQTTRFFFHSFFSGNKKKNLFYLLVSIWRLSSKCTDVVWSLWQWFPIHPFDACYSPDKSYAHWQWSQRSTV